VPACCCSAGAAKNARELSSTMVVSSTLPAVGESQFLHVRPGRINLQGEERLMRGIIRSAVSPEIATHNS
jgi:hypothetical protein